jgi:dihydroorotase
VDELRPAALAPRGAELQAHAELAVVNGRLVTPDGIVRGGVAIAGGRIVRLLGPGDAGDAGDVIDACGHYVLPGLIDSHVHFRTPGLTHKEDWEHGSRAAAAGGVTTVIDMPNTDPPLLDLDGCEQRAELVAGRSLVDFRFHPGVDEDSAAQLAAPAAREATSVKVFMTGHHTARHVVRDAHVLDAVFERAAQAGLRVLLHAEDDAVFALLDRARDAAGTSCDFERVRPRSGGIVAVARVIELVRRHGTAAHVLHVSSAEEVDLLSAAAGAGLPVTFEVTPHHLSFTAADVDRVGARLRLSPAIRRAEDRDRLWAAVLDGEVATIGSDHAPHTSEEKARPGLEAPPGLPGVQELLPALHTGLVSRLAGGADERMALIATRLGSMPADLFGLAARKGRLAVGLDGDLVIFDAGAEWTFDAAGVQARCGWSAYEGWRMIGRPLTTIRRGQVIWDAATGTFGRPDGVFLAAEPAVLPGGLRCAA